MFFSIGELASQLEQVVQKSRPKFISLFISLAVWQLLAMAGIINTKILPPPLQLSVKFGEMLRTGELLVHLLSSIKRVSVGFLIAASTGVLFGFALGVSRWANKYLHFLIELLRPIPPIAWIPLAILWFGIGDSPAYFIVSLGAFFPIFVNTHKGIKLVHRSYVLAARCLGAGRWMLIADVMLPAALPHIMTGLRVGMGVAWTSVIAAELVGAQSGLGYMIQTNRILLQTDKIVVGMIVIGVLGLIMNECMVILERSLLVWQEEIQHDS